MGFHEVSVSPETGGSTQVALRLNGREGPFAVDVRWLRLESIVLTTARVEPQ